MSEWVSFSRLLWVDIKLHADNLKAFIQNPATGILSVLYSKCFLFLPTVHSRSGFPFQGNLNTAQVESHPATWYFTPREPFKSSPQQRQFWANTQQAHSFPEHLVVHESWAAQDGEPDSHLSVAFCCLHSQGRWAARLETWLFWAICRQNVMTVPLPWTLRCAYKNQHSQEENNTIMPNSN